MPLKTSCAHGDRRARLSRCLALLALLLPPLAQAELTIAPITWDIIGLDSNRPAQGPRHFPVAARVCSDAATTGVQVDFAWQSVNPFVDLRPGTLATLTLGSLPAGGCADAYFEVEVQADPAAFGSSRRYRITASDTSGSVSTPEPRELYVEHLVSQSRNAITSIRYGADASSLVAVGPGGAMDLVVGQTYVIELAGSTATQGYEQLEAFINFTNTIFQILSVETSYTADTSVYVTSPHDRLYADACGWEPDPNSPNVRACVGTPGKAGGGIVTLYTIRIIGGGGSSQALNTLVYDFSGSSFHYNADFGVGARVANVIDPAAATIEKAFAPNPAALGGSSVLTFTLSNPNAGALGGFSFVDDLPAGMRIADPSGAATSGCGSPVLTAVAGTQQIAFADGTVGGNGSCSVRVNVTTDSTGSFTNTTANLFVGGVDTGDNATAVLVVDASPPPGTGVCGIELARWTFPSGFDVLAPAPSSASVSASAAAGVGLNANAQSTLTADGSQAWGSNGSITTGLPLGTGNDEYFEFAVDTTGMTEVTLAFDAQRRSANGPQGVAVYYGGSSARPESGTLLFASDAAVPAQNTTVSFGAANGLTANSGLNPSGPTFFRIYAYNSGNVNPGSDPVLDNVVLTGCGQGVPPTIAKAFATDPVAVGGTSTLVFTLDNPNDASLTDARFTDTLPAGLQVAAVPNASSTCGAGSFSPSPGDTSLSFGTPAGGTLPASGSCSVSVDVTATAAGTWSNVSGFLSTAETGTNTDSIATDTLTVLSAPILAKQFAPNPVLQGGVARLTFTIANPNLEAALGGVGFSDALPALPAQMQVAAVPNPSLSGCGAAAFAPLAGATALSVSGASVAAGGTCSIGVDVTAPAPGDYVNITSALGYMVNGSAFSAGSATDTLSVTAPDPAVNLLKQVGSSASGPWLGYLAVPQAGSVYYRFLAENTGDVPLANLAISDPQLPAAATGCSWPASLPVADALDEDHVATCVIGPVAASAGQVVNTADLSADGAGTPVGDSASATYATASLAIEKSASPTTYTGAGQAIAYTFVVTNAGAATLSGPLAVLDDRTADEACPPLASVGDLDAFFDPGEQLTCSASYTTNGADVSAGSASNTAVASNGTVQSPPDSATIVLAGPRLALAKSASPLPFVAGQPGTYAITVSNLGTAASSGDVMVSDTLPPGISLVSASGTGWNCSGSGALTCTFSGVLQPAPAAGSSTTLTLLVDVAAGTASASNSATASGGADPTCPGRAACTDTVAVPVIEPLLEISKLGVLDNTVVAPADQSNVGDRIDYTITVANTGTASASGVLVSDPRLPALACANGATPVVMPAMLAAGATLTCTGSYTLLATDLGGGSVDNTATVSAATVCNPTSPGSVCSASSTTPLGVVPVLQTSKSGVLDNAVVAPADESNVGDTIAYTIRVDNTGSGVAEDVSVADPMLALSCTVGGVATSPPTSLAAGAALICTGTHVLTAADLDNGSVANTVVASATNACNPVSPGSTCSASEDTPLALAPRLALSKTGTLDNTVVAPSTESNPGDTIAYTLTVSNTGSGIADNVSVSDPAIALACSIGGSSASLPVDLAPGASLVCAGTYALEAADIGNGAVANTATVSAANACNPASAGSSCSDSVTTPLGQVPNLTLDKMHTGDFERGQVGATFTLLVSNTGSDDSSGAVSVEDSLPSGLTATAMAGSGWSCTLATLACSRSDALAAGGAYPPITLTVDVAPDAPDTLVNTATVSGGGDTFLLDNSDDDAVTVLSNSTPDLALQKSHGGSFAPGGSDGHFLLLVSNAGGVASAGPVTVTDTLPTGMTALTVGGDGWACTLEPLACSRSDALPAGADYAVITVAVGIAEDASGWLTNVADVAGGGDGNPANNRDEDAVELDSGGGAAPPALPAPVLVPVGSPGATAVLVLLLGMLGGWAAVARAPGRVRLRHTRTR